MTNIWSSDMYILIEDMLFHEDPSQLLLYLIFFEELPYNTRTYKKVDQPQCYLLFLDKDFTILSTSSKNYLMLNGLCYIIASMLKTVESTLVREVIRDKLHVTPDLRE